MTDTFGFSFNSSFQHIGVDTFCKNYALWIAACSVVELAGEFAFVPHQFT